MELILENVGEVTVVKIPGDVLDAGNTREFKNDIAPVLDEHKRLVFDMSELTFVDSSGCGALLSCLRKVREGKGELKLCKVSTQVRDLFSVIRMDQVFQILNSRDEAVKAFTA